MNEFIGMVSYKMIKDFFDGKCSEDEKKRILEWVNSSAQNKEIFLRWEEIYFLGKHHVSEEDYMMAEKRLLTKIDEQEKASKVKSRRMYSFMRYAAVIVMLLTFSGLAYWYFNRNDYNMVCLATADGETKELILPDGSKVWLNGNTTLEYPESFTDDVRMLYLNGEAYFEVTPNKHKPFIVRGATMQIEVLGTKFNFKNSTACRIAEASLLEGEIRASGNADEGLITLEPGQKVELNTYTRKMKVSDTNAEMDAIWHNEFVQLTNANIYDIALLLEKIYKVNIVLSPELKKTNTYSGVLQKKGSIREVLEVLSKTIHFNYKISEQNIFLSVE